MTGTLLSFSVMALSIRGLASRLTIFEILTVRTLGALVILFSLAVLKPQFFPQMAPRRMGLNLLRNSVHFGALYGWALSLTLLPLATVFALEFTMPIWLALIAVFFLGEKLTPSRIGVIVLGFIGTVLGLSDAIGGFGGVLESAGEISEITQALKGVTAGLYTAFDTTLVALIAALVIQLLLTFLKKAEEEFLDACAEYCSRHVVGRLRVMPFERDRE